MASVPRSVENGRLVQVDEEMIRGHVNEVVRSSVEATLSGLLDAEADQLCRAKRYERTQDRVDTRAGSYDRKLQTKAGEVTLKVPRLRSLPFETQIIERYRRRESSGRRSPHGDVPGAANRSNRLPLPALHNKYASLQNAK